MWRVGSGARRAPRPGPTTAEQRGDEVTATIYLGSSSAAAPEVPPGRSAHRILDERVGLAQSESGCHKSGCQL
ncbi:MAG: hypothetical protein M3460_16955 [Actinomycetota bacterium]|nr:hypothetical protein [Actinomycetota bacterium]